MSIVAFCSYLVLYYSDPGHFRSNKRAVFAARHLWERDALMYPLDKPPTCHCLSEEDFGWDSGEVAAERVPRSKHCTDGCGECTLRFDHHCVWANNCIGLFNLRWFLLFLGTTAILCFYAAALSLAVLFASLDLKGELSLFFVGQLLYVAVYCTCTGIVLTGLLLVSLRQIVANVTTYEAMKTERLLKAMEMLKKGRRSKILTPSVLYELEVCLKQGISPPATYGHSLGRRLTEALLPELLLGHGSSSKVV